MASVVRRWYHPDHDASTEERFKAISAHARIRRTVSGGWGQYYKYSLNSPACSSLSSRRASTYYHRSIHDHTLSRPAVQLYLCRAL